MKELNYVENAYNVPATIGRKVTYTGGRKPKSGAITRIDGAHIRIAFDGGGGKEHPGKFHPTWEMQYHP